MSVRRVVPNIVCEDLEASRAFYEGVFGFETVMDMEWIVTVASPDNRTAQVSLVKGTTGASQEAVTLSIEVEDVDAVHGKAVALGCRIVYPLTDEPWGVRRFHLHDPSGVLVNVLSHAN